MQSLMQASRSNFSLTPALAETGESKLIGLRDALRILWRLSPLGQQPCAALGQLAALTLDSNSSRAGGAKPGPGEGTGEMCQMEMWCEIWQGRRRLMLGGMSAAGMSRK